MKKWGWLCMLLLGVAVWAEAQTGVCVRVGDEAVDVAEFRLFCHRQNDARPDVRRFVDFKLKALAARQAELDTLPQIRRAVDRFRNRWLKACLTDSAKADSAAWTYYQGLQARKYAGRVLVSHIFQSVPQNVTAAALARVEQRMDSLYQVLEAGEADFTACVEACSEEKTPFWVDYLQMPVEFENVVFSLPVGQLSRPFFTPQGIHIVKVLDRKELPSFDVLKERLERRLVRGEWSEAVSARVVRLKTEYGYRPDKAGMNELLRRGKTDKTLFLLGGCPYSGDDFARFAAAHPAALKRQLELFVVKTVLDHESRSLGEQSPEFATHLSLFRDSLLAAEMGHRAIGCLIPADTVGVAQYFEANRKHYQWPQPRYEGIVLHCRTKRIARRTRKFLKKLPVEEWQEAIRLGVNAGGVVNVRAEQGLFAAGDNPYVDEHLFGKGEARPLADFPYTAWLGRKVKGPECWQEVGRRLWTDYYRHLEAGWLDELHRKFKVEINQEVLKTVNNH